MSKRLIIIRHGKSSWDFPHLSDLERPLKPRGVKDAGRLAPIVKQWDLGTIFMVSSPANRAHSTAKLFAEHLSYPLEDIEVDKRIYFEGSHAMFEVARRCDDRFHTQFMFGHNPDITTLANKVTNQYIGNVPTTGILNIEFPVNSWENINFDQANLASFEYASKYR